MRRTFLGRPSISLTGFMFTGKSSVGRTLARRLGLVFVDLDTEIVRREGDSINNIFERRGEEVFRRLEREAVARVIPARGQVVATGGGVVLERENREIMAAHSCVVWLRASKETILERSRESRGRVRPLLSVEDPEKVITDLLRHREPFYGECSFAVDTDNLSVNEVCDSIIKSICALDQDREGA
ncbi:MAG: shikimate kinase [Gemmatimonadota bacterium]|nr:shikimate kinase [Gemmatimonadota bacterium]